MKGWARVYKGVQSQAKNNSPISLKHSVILLHRWEMSEYRYLLRRVFFLYENLVCENLRECFLNSSIESKWRLRNGAFLTLYFLVPVSSSLNPMSQFTNKNSRSRGGGVLHLTALLSQSIPLLYKRIAWKYRPFFSVSNPQRSSFFFQKRGAVLTQCSVNEYTKGVTRLS